MSNNAPEMTCGELAAILAELSPGTPIFVVGDPTELANDIGLAPSRIPVRRVVTMQSQDGAINYVRIDSWYREMADMIPSMADIAE